MLSRVAKLAQRTFNIASDSIRDFRHFRRILISKQIGNIDAKRQFLLHDRISVLQSAIYVLTSLSTEKMEQGFTSLFSIVGLGVCDFVAVLNRHLTRDLL